MSFTILFYGTPLTPSPQEIAADFRLAHAFSEPKRTAVHRNVLKTPKNDHQNRLNRVFTLRFFPSNDMTETVPASFTILFYGTPLTPSPKEQQPFSCSDGCTWMDGIS